MIDYDEAVAGFKRGVLITAMHKVRAGIFTPAEVAGLLSEMAKEGWLAEEIEKVEAEEMAKRAAYAEKVKREAEEKGRLLHREKSLAGIKKSMKKKEVRRDIDGNR